MPRLTSLQRKRRPPNISATRQEKETESQPIVGFTTYPTNDIHPDNKWRLAQDVRIPEVGDYETRKGCDPYSIPVGEAIASSEVSVAGAGVQEVDFTTRACQIISGVTDPISAVEFNIQNTTNAIGVVAIYIHEDNGGLPGKVIGESSVANNSIIVTPQYIKARFIEAPTPAGDIWVCVYAQDGGSNTFGLTTTTNTTNAQISTDRGQTWAAAGYSLNYNLYTATPGGTKGLIRVNRPSGTKHTIFAHGDSLYEVNNGTGVVTPIVAGLNAAATNYRFDVAQDTLYYVNGDKPYEYDFATNTQIAAAPNNASNLIEYKGFMIYMDADDKTRIFISEFAQYGTFVSTDFIYVDAPKKPDILTAFAKLDNLIIFSRNDKHVLYGSNRSTWSLGDALGQKGTFTQESVAYDMNSVYFASDDGIYRYDGSGDVLISQDILEDWRALTKKENTVLELHNNRLYVFYTPNGQTENTECLVYHLELQVWESVDTDTHIGHTFSRLDTEDLFLQASNKVGAVYYGERSSNDHSNLDGPIDMKLHTNHSVFGTAVRYKDIRDWFARFEAGGTGYSVQCVYGVDLLPTLTSQDVLLQPDSTAWDNNTESWDNNTLSWDGGAQLIETGNNQTTPEIRIDGLYRRIMVGYEHNAAREPVRFKGHTLLVHTSRVR